VRVVAVATDPGYEVRIGRGLLREVDGATRALGRRAVVTDERVAELYLRPGEAAGKAARTALHIDVPSLAIPAGEASKRIATLERILEFLAASDLDRSSCVIALGGGVVGDLAGLAASLYMRGIAVAQVPTTLLAQVDASVGGKTGVDLEAGKNLAGTFHAPAVVLADTETLATLTDSEFRSGLGEVLKSAWIDGEVALGHLEADVDAILGRDPDALEEVVERCVRLKAGIVGRDPRESGERKSLNLGHTFAHGIEHATGYGRIPHGVAVAVGLSIALRTSRRLGILEDPGTVERTEALLRALGLPANLRSLSEAWGSKIGAREVLAGMRHDKKGTAGVPRLVLPRAPGKIELDVEVGLDLLAEMIEAA
jgi:3-dehydroquinate synthase